jgi:hypothetical protein
MTAKQVREAIRTEAAVSGQLLAKLQKPSL